MDNFFKYFLADVGRVFRAFVDIFAAFFNFVNYLFNFPMRLKLIRSIFCSAFCASCFASAFR